MAVRDEGLDSHFDCYLAEYHSRSNYVNINVDPHLPRRFIENDSAERERERSTKSYGHILSWKCSNSIKKRDQ